MTPELQSKIALYRQKAALNQLTTEEMIEAIKLIREGRHTAAATAKSTKTAAAKKVIVNADDLLSDWMS